MPYKITKVVDQEGGNANIESQLLEIIIPRSQRDPMSLSDKEADALYSAWKVAAPGAESMSLNGIDDKTLTNLKAKGYINPHFGTNQFSLTEKARSVIIDLVTNEPNELLRQSVGNVSYAEVRAKKSASKRKIQSLIKKAGVEEREETKPFNLREWSVRRMDQ